MKSMERPYHTEFWVLRAKVRRGELAPLCCHKESVVAIKCAKKKLIDVRVIRREYFRDGVLTNTEIYPKDEEGA